MVFGFVKMPSIFMTWLKVDNLDWGKDPANFREKSFFCFFKIRVQNSQTSEWRHARTEDKIRKPIFLCCCILKQRLSPPHLCREVPAFWKVWIEVRHKWDITQNLQFFINMREKRQEPLRPKDGETSHRWSWELSWKEMDEEMNKSMAVVKSEMYHLETCAQTFKLIDIYHHPARWCWHTFRRCLN